ncbi:hypothetical protein IC229_20045 [Spirosoma sp. BT702]|uniref:Uncharacterized protein n=1 Tax=Spirosoma profusum TaxID=2771354 RepID=A0A926XXW6_9BACT|nr:hypothetical protein [Spirosoma profusum]MBD2702949.1 hypothetical protein [Spirosoma profusum]
MLTSLLLYRQFKYQTTISPAEIQQKLDANVITGFSFMSAKPYYGEISPYDFSIRKTAGTLKKESLSPTLHGSYLTQDGQTLVSLTLVPHLIFIIAIALFGFPCLLFVIRGIQEAIRSGDVVILLNCFFPLMILYGIFWAIFQVQSQADIRFWEYTLGLRKLPQV